MIGLNHMSNCNQYVSINRYEPCLVAINCDFPQGSVIETLLFLLHINDLKILCYP